MHMGLCRKASLVNLFARTRAVLVVPLPPSSVTHRPSLLASRSSFSLLAPHSRSSPLTSPLISHFSPALPPFFVNSVAPGILVDRDGDSRTGIKDEENSSLLRITVTGLCTRTQWGTRRVRTNERSESLVCDGTRLVRRSVDGSICLTPAQHPCRGQRLPS